MESCFFIKEGKDHEAAHMIIFGIRILLVIQSLIVIFMALIYSVGESFKWILVGVFAIDTVVTLVLDVIDARFEPTGRASVQVGNDLLEISYGKITMIILNGESLIAKLIKKSDIEVICPALKKAPGGLYVSYQLAGGRKLQVIWSSKDKHAVLIDDEVVVINNQIYKNKIDNLFTNQIGTRPAVTQKLVSVVPGNIYNTKTEQSMSLARYTLKAIAGVKAGQSWKLDAPLRIGRNPEACQIVFEQNTQGVSRMHCEVGVRNGKAYIKDLGATYGTMLSNGTMVKDYAEYELTENMTFTMGTKESFMVVKE